MLGRLKRFIRRNDRLYRLFSPLIGFKVNWAMLKPRLLHGIDDNLAVFSAYQMRTYSDNPRYISEALHALRPQTDIVWLLRDVKAARAKHNIPDYVRCLPFPSPEASEAAGRARVIVDNWRKRDFIRLGRRQVYIFSPHYDRGFKRAGLINPKFKFNRMVESHCDLGVIASEVHAEYFRQAYRYKGPFMMEGLPRNDILLRNDPAETARLRAKIGLDGDSKVLIYAPTYRDSDHRARRDQRVELDLNHVLDVLKRATGRRWVCLYRAHYFTQGLVLNGSSDRLIDATDYPEMAELLYVSDALITDYSSCAGDFALCGRPIWLYQADIADYQQNDRQLYFDMAELPFWTASSPEALDALIERTTPEAARENCRAILDFYRTHESGESARRVAEYMCEKLGSRE